MGSPRDSKRLRLRTRHLLTGVIVGGLSSVLVSACLTPEFNKRTTDENANSNGGANLGPAHCNNREADKDETDVDCGGLDCPPCALGRSCSVPGDCENGACTSGICQAASCTDDEKNDTETDVDCGGDCPPCADSKRCKEGDDCESASCKGGSCAAATCEDRIKNGSESGIDCGGDCSPCDSGQPCVVNSDCAQPHDTETTTATCQEGTCELLCPVGLGDCNLMAADGCEANLNTELSHCGACGDVCQPDNAAAAKCQGGECLVDFENGGCNTDFADCNGSALDGCEVNTATDPEHCGACNDACSSHNGTPSCSGGSCEISCTGNYRDCDDDAQGNGCEADTGTSILDCGACGTVCTPAPGQSASCDLAATPPCVSIACDAGSDCGGVQPCGACGPDQVCNDLLNTTSNCGGCGIQCSATNGTTSCAPSGSTFACEIASCTDSADADWEDCDEKYINGCEANVQVDTNNCGGCAGKGGQDCAALQANASLNIASISCSDGGCEITGCKGTTADCDGNPNNGCEVDTASDDLRCGGCLDTDENSGSGANCNTAWSRADGNCVDSACVFNKCDSGFGNCKNGLSDGCETDVRNNDTHCGSCNAPCLTNGSTSSNSCSASQCVAVCGNDADQCDSDPWNGCEALNTVSNCSSCGDVCGTSAPFCTSAGCKDHLLIEMIDASSTVSATASAHTLSLTHPLKTSRGTNSTRAVVAFIGYRGNNVDLPPTVTYGGKAMTAGSAYYSGNQAWSGIYYILDADLPSTSGDKTFVVTGNTNNTVGLTARVVELLNVDQSSPVGASPSKKGQQGCSNTLSTSGLATDSWVFSNMTIWADVTLSATGSQTAFSTLEAGDGSSVAGYEANVEDSTHGWSCSSTQNWSHVMLALQPEGSD